MQGEQDICLNFKVQVVTANQVREHRASSPDESDLIEDATAEWNYPFVNVATLTIAAPQNTAPSNDSQAACKKHAFNPWHSLQTHQPLGGINRLRKPVYVLSEVTRFKP